MLLRSYGGKPSNLLKSELVSEIRKYSTSALASAGAASTAPGASAGTEGIAVDIPKSTQCPMRYKDPLPPKPTAPYSTHRHKVGSSGPQSVDITSGQFNVKSAPRVWTSSNAPSSNTPSKAGSATKPVHANPAQSTFYQEHQREYRPRDGVAQCSGNSERREARLLGEEPVGEMEITFLGTASCIPGLTRGVSCVALRYCTETWLFDCGEGTQLQIRKSKIRPGKISKIFITHTHGDHAFGLAGVLCSIGSGLCGDKADGMSNDDWLEPIDIYGPPGIRDLVRAVVQLSYSKVAAPHRIHELKEVPYLHSGSAPRAPQLRTRFDPMYGEREGGRDIFPDADGHYHLFSDKGVTVKAAPMVHSIPCVGYVVHEDDRPGALRPEVFNSLVAANKDALSAQYLAENKNPMWIYRDIKALQPDEAFTFPDGNVIYGRDVVCPPIAGRKVVYMGDTCSGQYIAELARDADVLIHEATNAFFPSEDSDRHGSYANLEKESKYRGHSTPQMAGRFAAQIRARKLLLTHFSARYSGDPSDVSMRIMWQFEGMARSAYEQYFRQSESSERANSTASGNTSNNSSSNISSKTDNGQHSENTNITSSRSTYRELGKNDVMAAWDFLSLNIGRPDHAPRSSATKLPHVNLHE